MPKGIPNRIPADWHRQANRKGERAYDEAEMRRLVAPVSEGGEGLTQKRAAQRLGCSYTAVWLAVHPHRRMVAEQARAAYYRTEPEDVLQRLSDWHYQHIERHETMLSEIEAEIARRRKETPRA